MNIADRITHLKLAARCAEESIVELSNERNTYENPAADALQHINVLIGELTHHLENAEAIIKRKAEEADLAAKARSLSWLDWLKKENPKAWELITDPQGAFRVLPVRKPQTGCAK